MKFFVAAHRLKHCWVGIDIAIHAIKRVSGLRLRDRLRLVQGQDYTIEGVPRNVEGAKDLWERDPYHFQKWAVEEVDGFVTTKRTADGGIDGRLYFDYPGKQDLQSMAIEVKGGKNVGIRDLRALHGVIENDLALMGGLIVLEPLGERKTQNFKREMYVSDKPYLLRFNYSQLRKYSRANALTRQAPLVAA